MAVAYPTGVSSPAAVTMSLAPGEHLTPYIAHPTLCTRRPTPYTLHPTPYNLHLKPYTLHPTPYTLNLALCTLHSTPYTLHFNPAL